MGTKRGVGAEGQGTDVIRETVMDLVQAAIRAADPYAAVMRMVRRRGEILDVGGREYNLERYRRVLVLGAGKASALMAVALEEILGERIEEGLVVVKYGYTAPTRIVALREAGHPVPDERGVDAARELAAIAARAQEGDLVILLISGGGSALLTLPAPDISLADKKSVTEVLLRSGATVNEMNIVRKHLSQIKGGRLASLVYPADSISLIVSDVIGDPLDVIASGPTAPDPSTFEDALGILRRRGVLDVAPPAVVAHLERGRDGCVEDTPKPGHEVFKKTYALVVCNNRVAAEAVVDRARELGYNALLLTAYLEGEAREVGRVLASLAKEIALHNSPFAKPACVVLGGETTVTVRGGGLGGRNQELVLSSAGMIDGLPGAWVASFGTDGTDGPTDAAGAIGGGSTCTRARYLGLDWQDYLARNDSYHFFCTLGDLVITGPTNTNVNDISFILAKAT